MKTPIKPEDIRKGDLIRCEWKASEAAEEWRSTDAGSEWHPSEVDHYLLDRPRTLLYPAGTNLWLTRDFYPWKSGARITLAEDWYDDQEDGFTTEGSPARMRVTDDAVTDKPTKTAVPTEALDDLREPPPVPVPNHWYRNRTARFLAAVDEANA